MSDAGPGAPPPATPPPVDPARDHLRGEGGRTLLMYGDYECPYTRAAYRTVRVLESRGVPFTFVFRHFPLTEIHPHALQASVAAEAAAEQGRFWDMHDTLFAHQTALERDDLRGYASALGLDRERFDAGFASEGQIDRIAEDLRGGLEAGVRGTPSLFIDGDRVETYELEALHAALADQ